MQDSSRFIRLSLKGKQEYTCLVTPELFIVEVDPHNEYLVNKSLNEIYEKYSGKIDIHLMSIEDPKPIIAYDKYDLFESKNPSIKYLKEKFNTFLL